MQCEAKSKQSGHQCKRHAVAGKTVCAIHGGKTPSGIASPQLVHGRYSKHLPSKLAGLYQTALADEELLNLRQDVALIDTRLAELIGRIEEGDAGTAWMGVRDTYRHLAKAINEKDVVSTAIYLSDLGAYIDDGLAERGLWEEISRLLDQRRRLTESERKRLIEAQQVITAEKAMLLVGAIVGIIKANVTDRDTLSKISADIERLVAA